MTRSRAGTHMIEHLADGIADHMRSPPPRVPPPRVPAAPSAAVSHMTKAESRSMTLGPAPVEQFADR
jgi:hypothetical protein